MYQRHECSLYLANRNERARNRWAMAALWLMWATASHAASEFYVARRGWHVDVGFAVTDLPATFAPLAADFPGARYLFFGFGDRHYLLAAHGRSPSMLLALWPGRALILATGLRASPAEAFGASQVVALRLDEKERDAAAAFVLHSLEGPPLPQPLPGPYPGSEYFAARGRYSALYTCNTWVAETLRETYGGEAYGAGTETTGKGLDHHNLHSRGVLFAGQVWRMAHRLASEQQHHGPQSPPRSAPSTTR